jgi:hypothetical protein
MNEFVAGAVLVAFIAFVFYRLSKSKDDKPHSGDGKESPWKDDNTHIQ